MPSSRLNLIPALLVWLAPGLASAEVIVTGLDAVTSPGTPVLLTAKFEQDLIGPIQPDMKGAKVRFRFQNKERTDLTDPDGMAEAQFLPKRPGAFPFEAELVDEPDAPVAKGTVYVVPKTRPVAVVDIDGTLSDMASWRVLVSAAKAETFEGAPELLRDLSKTHQVVYLTARDDHFAAATRTFLARHEYPPGPVLFNTWGLLDPRARAQLAPSNHGEFKLRTLELLKKRGLKLTLGIGDSETDAEAYEGAKIRSCLRTEVKKEGETFRFQRYAQLREKLVADGVLKEPPEQD